MILKDEVYNERGDQDQIQYDEKIRDYYRTRTGGGHGISWTEQVATLLSEKSRPHMKGFWKNRVLNLNETIHRSILE